MTGSQYQQRVLEPRANGLAPAWRVKQAIEARRTIEPTYNPAWFTPETAAKTAA